MMATRFGLVLAALLVVGGLLLLFPGEVQADHYRTIGMTSTWYTWTQGGLWQRWVPSQTNWVASGPPGPADIAYIQAQVNIPAGTTVQVQTLYVGDAHCSNNGTWGGWWYYPSYRHQLRVYGTLNVTMDLYVVDDTLEVFTGGTINVTGMFYIGLGSGYINPSSTNQLYSCQYNQPRLNMSGGMITVRYGATNGNPLHAGGMIFWPGSTESITGGVFHIHGWLVGADYSTMNRYWDLGNGSSLIYLDGTTYPATTTTFCYCYDYNNASRDLKLQSLQIDRVGGRRIQFNSHVEVYGDFILLNGHLQATTNINLRFRGGVPATWTSVGNSSYSGFVPDPSGKAARLRVYSTIMIPGFSINNPNANFDLELDDQGVYMGFLQILNGRVFMNTATVEIHGYLQVGQANPPSSATPRFDMLNAGRVWVRGLLGGPIDGDFYFLQGASGTFNSGTLEVEGNFGVDNGSFAAGSSHTVIMSGTVGTNAARLGTGGGGLPVKIWNNQIPTGYTNATCILNNFIVNKTGANPGNQVNVLSDLEINGNLGLVSGILNGATGWTVKLFGQWPMNPPLGSGQGFTGNTALEIRTPGRFVLPGGQGPIIRVNKNDVPQAPSNNQDLCEMGGNMSCYGLQVWDGRFNFMGFQLHLTGNFTVGSGNAAVNQINQPVVEMLAASGGGGLDVDATGGGDGNITVYNHSIVSIDSGRIDVDGDIMIDASGFRPTGSNVVRITGNRGTECQMWSNKPPGGALLQVENLVFMKTGTDDGSRMNLGSAVEVNGTFTMVSGKFNASLPAPFNSTQVLHLKGSPNAWVGTGGSYTNAHNPNGPPFTVVVDGVGPQTCFTGLIQSPQIPPDITILKTPDASGESVGNAGGVLHGSVIFVADGTLDVGSGAVIAEQDFFVGSSTQTVEAPVIRMNDLNGLIEVRRDFYFMVGSVEDITDGILRVCGDMRITDSDSVNPAANFDLFDLGTERVVVELTGSASGTAEIFRSLPPPTNTARPLNLFDLIINKNNTSDLIEAYSDVNVNGSFQVLKGTLDTPGGVLNIRSNWMTSTGAAYVSTANLSLNGRGGLQYITSQVSLPNVRVDKPQSSPPGPNAAVVPPGGQLFTKNFWIRQGTLRLNGGTITVSGDFVVGGVAVAADSPATLEISAATGGGNLFIQHPAGATGAGNFYFNGANNEAVNVDAGTIRVTGRFAVGSTTFQLNGTNMVEMSGNRGSRGEIWNASGPLRLASLTINKTGSSPGNQVDLISDIDLGGHFQMIQGVFNTNNFPHFAVGGNWTIANGCIFIPTVCTVEFTGVAGSPSSISNESQTAPFYNLHVALPAGTAALNYYTTSGRVLQVNRELLVRRGILTVPPAGQLDVGSTSAAALLQIGAITDPTADGSLNLSPNSTLVMSGNSRLSVEGGGSGTLRLLGTPGNTVTITTTTPGTARFEFKVAGRIEAKYYRINSPKATGVEFLDSILLGSDPDNLSWGAFDYPEASGVLLNLAAMNSTTKLPLSIRFCEFSNTGTVAGARNVRGSSGWSTGSDLVYFLQSSGNLAGEINDDDPADAQQDGYIRWMIGTVDVTAGNDNPADRSVLRQSGATVVLQASLEETSDTQNVALETLTFTETGPTGYITSADLYVDADNNGVVGGSDPHLGTAVYSGAPARATFGTAGITMRTLSAGTTTNVLLVYTFSPTTPTASVFHPSIAARTDLTGTVGLATINMPAEVTGTFPLEGGVLTVNDRGSLTLDLGPYNPPTGQIIQGMQDASMQQLTVTAGTEENILVQSLRFRLTGGSGATSTMLYSVRLIEDTNADGFFTTGEPVRATVAAWSSTVPWTVNFTGSPILTVPAGESRNLLLTCQVLASAAPGGPVGGETFQTAVPTAGDVGAQGVVSGSTAGSASILGVFPLDGNVQTCTLQPSILAIVGQNNPRTRGIDKAWQDVPMIQARLVGLGEDILVSSIQFNNTGTVNPAVACSGASLVLDANDNGVFDAGETALGTATSVGAQVVFNWSAGNEPVLRSNRPTHWLLCYDFNGAGTNNDTLTVSVPFGGVAGAGVTTPISGVTGLPISGGTVTLLEGVGTLTAAPGAGMPAPASVSRSAVDRAMLQIRLQSGPNEALRVTGVTVHSSGTGDELNDVTQVTLINDADGDGMRTAVDALLGVGFFSADEGSVTFNGSSGGPLFSMDRNKTAHLLVLYTFNGTADHASTFQARIDSAASIAVIGQMSLADIVPSGSFPLPGPEMEVVIPGTLTLSLGSRSPQTTYEMIGSRELSMLQVSLEANENEDLRVQRFAVNASGTGHDVNDVVQGSVKLFRDLDRNGILSAPDEEILPTTYANFPQIPVGWGSFGSDDGIVTFDHLDEVITANTNQLWIVVMDIANSTGLGSTFSLGIPDNTAAAAVGVRSTEQATISGAPLLGGTKTVVAWGTGGSVSVYPGLNTSPPRSELATAANVEMVQIALVASTVENVRINGMTISHRGTGNPTVDITQVRLYRDETGNGLLDLGDTLLGTLLYDTSGQAHFPFTHEEVVPRNSEKTYLVVYDLSGSAPNGTTFIAGIQNNTDVLAQGLDSFANISVAGAPVDGSAMLIGTTGSLIVSYGPNNPPSSYVHQSTDGVAMMHLSFRATSPEELRVKTVSFHAGGTADDSTSVTASLFADYDGNGMVDGPDHPIGPINQVYNADNGTVTFNNVDYVVPAGTTAYALLVYNFYIVPAADWGKTYEARIIPSLDVSCEGTTSGSPLYSAGSLLFSNRIRVGYPPGFEKYLNQPGASSGGGCFVATASFGGRDSAEVRTLSAFRDRFLLTNAPGRWFVRSYYRLSPAAADFIRERPAARAVSRYALMPLAGFAGALTAPSPWPLVLAFALVASLLLAVAVLARRSLKLTR